jgi:hypothetical protein
MRKLKSEEFHQAVIGGHHLVAGLSADGPYINLMPFPYGGGVALGHATHLYKVEKDRRRTAIEPTWAICKYGPHEIRIVLKGLTDDQAQEVSQEFGIPIGRDRETNFYTGRSWPHMIEWVRSRPRIAKRCAEDAATSYVGDWHGRAKRALADRPAPAVASDQGRGDNLTGSALGA